MDYLQFRLIGNNSSTLHLPRYRLNEIDDVLHILMSNKNIQELDLSGTECEGKEALEIGKAIASSPSLHTLRLTEADNDGIVFVRQMIRGLSDDRKTIALKNLYLDHVVIEDLDYLAWSLQHSSLRSLEFLSCVYMYVLHPTTTPIMEALPHSSLRMLDLSYCSLGRAAKALGEALKNPSIKLKTLIMQSCGIQRENARHLCEGLAFNTSLLSMDISNNNFNEEGMTALAKALETNIDLQTISVAHTFIGPASVGKREAILEDIEAKLHRNNERFLQRRRRIATLLRYRRSFHAWRDRSRIFIPAREGRVIELRVRLRWGKLAGGLSLKGNCDGELMTPLKAATKRGHDKCVELLVKASF